MEDDISQLNGNPSCENCCYEAPQKGEMVLLVEAMYNLRLPIIVAYEQHILEVEEGIYYVGLKNN